NQFIFGAKPYTIQNIDLQGPVPLQLAMHHGLPVLIGPARRAWDILREHLAERKKQPKSSVPVVLRRVALGPVDLLIYDQPPSDMEAGGGSQTAGNATAGDQGPP